jgi:hypothetical protein
VTGIDPATLSWGYAYHTPLDQPSIIEGPDQLRRLGGSLLAKVENIAGGLHLTLSRLEEEEAARGTGRRGEEAAERGTGGRAGTLMRPEATVGDAAGCDEGPGGGHSSHFKHLNTGFEPHIGVDGGVGGGGIGGSGGCRSGGATHRAPHQNHQTHDRPPGAVFFDLFGYII